MLHLWNTRSRSYQEVVPLHPPEVGVYSCGPTVYSEPTIGNWRKYIGDDVLVRTLALFGYVVRHVTNITDVGHLVDDGDMGEDKLQKRATALGQTAWDIARRYEALFLEGLDALHIQRPTLLPRATEHIPEQIALIQALERAGHTYRTSDGIYFDTATFPQYGLLSGQRLDQKEAGARVEVHAEKRQQSDFALWKFSHPNEYRHMEWESPWGVGFPGWHIECSAMSAKYLGTSFDIHTGGVDHIPVHHENEIAQSECLTHQPLARHWVHHEFLLVDGGRMGKSLGNGYTLEDLRDRGYEPMTYRYFVLGAHYRSKLNFTWEGLDGAKQALAKLKNAYLSWEDAPETAPNEQILGRFREALAEDLHTPKALALVWELVKADMPASQKRATLREMDQVLGLGVELWHQEVQEIPEEVQRLAEERQQARAQKDWAASDRLRDALAEQGWMIRDTSEGFELSPLE